MPTTIPLIEILFLLRPGCFNFRVIYYLKRKEYLFYWLDWLSLKVFCGLDLVYFRSDYKYKKNDANSLKILEDFSIIIKILITKTEKILEI